MAFYAPQLPLRRDKKNGYVLLETLSKTIKQNFKMLVLTVPGERIMNPDFGVGLYRYLFEMKPPYSDVEERIYASIKDQTRKYMPTIKVTNVSFFYDDSSNPLQEENTLYVKIEYYIKSLNAKDILEVSLNSNF